MCPRYNDKCVKVIEATAGMSANADIADESILKTCLEGRYGRKEEQRQSKHHVSQRDQMLEEKNFL